jgi:hypothetical protein
MILVTIRGSRVWPISVSGYSLTVNFGTSVEALAAERKQSGEKVEFASARLNDSISLASARAE